MLDVLAAHAQVALAATLICRDENCLLIRVPGNRDCESVAYRYGGVQAEMTMASALLMLRKRCGTRLSKM